MLLIHVQISVCDFFFIENINIHNNIYINIYKNINTQIAR